MVGCANGRCKVVLISEEEEAAPAMPQEVLGMFSPAHGCWGLLCTGTALLQPGSGLPWSSVGLA